MAFQDQHARQHLAVLLTAISALLARPCTAVNAESAAHASMEHPGSSLHAGPGPLRTPSPIRREKIGLNEAPADALVVEGDGSISSDEGQWQSSEHGVVSPLPPSSAGAYQAPVYAGAYQAPAYAGGAYSSVPTAPSAKAAYSTGPSGAVAGGVPQSAGPTYSAVPTAGAATGAWPTGPVADGAGADGVSTSFAGTAQYQAEQAAMKYQALLHRAEERAGLPDTAYTTEKPATFEEREVIEEENDGVWCVVSIGLIILAVAMVKSTREQEAEAQQVVQEKVAMEHPTSNTLGKRGAL